MLIAMSFHIGQVRILYNAFPLDLTLLNIACYL